MGEQWVFDVMDQRHLGEPRNLQVPGKDGKSKTRGVGVAISRSRSLRWGRGQELKDATQAEKDRAPTRGGMRGESGESMVLLGEANPCYSIKDGDE